MYFPYQIFALAIFVLTMQHLQEAPPLIPTLTSGRYHIKWTKLANLPVPLYCSCVAVQDQIIYVAGHLSPFAEVREQIYAYNIATDQWSQLPSPGRYHGTPQTIGGRLSIIGGCLSGTGKRTNKVMTFDKTTKKWMSYYPNLLTTLSKPGVVAHQEYVIVAGGLTGDGSNYVPLDDIEVLNWVENSHWIKVPTHLPLPMYDVKPIISDGSLLFVEYYKSKFVVVSDGYKMPVADIMSPVKQHTTWTKITPTSGIDVALVSNSSPPIVIGGHRRSLQDANRDPKLSKYYTTANIEMYDDSSKCWKKIDSLSFARTATGVAAVGNNAIIVIGGGTDANASSSAITTVELGQAELS